MGKCTVGLYSSAMQRSVLCLLATVAAAAAAGLYGGVNVDKNSAGIQGEIVFPKIPGFNSPFFGFNLFPTYQPQQQQQEQQQSTSNGFSGFDPFGIFRPRQSQPPKNPSKQERNPLLFNIPNVEDLIPQIPLNLNTTDLEIPQLPPLPLIPPIPGLRDAIQMARDHVNITLGIGTDLIDGIQQAIEEALNSDDPTDAIHTLVTTILNAYLDVARNCPAIIIGFRVLQEGIRLSGEVAKSVRNVLVGRETT
ncbi:uncharacterized protein LOC107047981 [Diachasma alloeum]|uniref:uncharacterized protein LOC107047981 n=1 Tax=Diachasma alloeum TaxID=454923 RepID=UPI0007382387|nr:uncharacterized protein LOC107047981 [Diachasma alloeum]